MRFTQVLFKRKPNLRRIYIEKWKTQGKMPIAPLQIPQELVDSGVKIYDAKEVAQLREPKLEKKDSTDLITLSDNSQKFYVFDNTIRVTERESQVGALTKTLCYDGLPPPLSSLVGLESIRNQDQLVQKVALQALVTDGQLVKLPKKLDITRPGHVFPREYGIRYKRKAFNLMEKLAFLAEMGSGKYRDSLSRIKVMDAYTEVPIERAGDKVVFQLLSDFLFTSSKPLEPFATPEEVESTKDIELPSIYPVKPTLDLIQLDTDPCENTKIDVLDADVGRNQHVHTLHMIHKSFGFWFPVQKLSRAIASCFCFAAEEARRLYGNDVKEIPRPISLQCVFSDVKTFGFVAYQLNTLDLEDDKGVKNLAWYDGPHDLYEDVSEMHGFTGFNNDVFSKLLAIYLNGAHPESITSAHRLES